MNFDKNYVNKSYTRPAHTIIIIWRKFIQRLGWSQDIKQKSHMNQQ